MKWTFLRLSIPPLSIVSGAASSTYVKASIFRAGAVKLYARSQSGFKPQAFPQKDVFHETVFDIPHPFAACRPPNPPQRPASASSKGPRRELDIPPVTINPSSVLLEVALLLNVRKAFSLSGRDRSRKFTLRGVPFMEPFLNFTPPFVQSFSSCGFFMVSSQQRFVCGTRLVSILSLWLCILSAVLRSCDRGVNDSSSGLGLATPGIHFGFTV